MNDLPAPSSTGSAGDGGWTVPGLGRQLVDVTERVERLAGAFVTGADLTPARAQLVGLRELIDQLEAVWLEAVAGFDEAGGPQDDGCGSLVAWLRHRCRIAPGEAQARARVAHAITGPLAVTGDAMRDGQLSWRHADVIDRTLRDVPPDRRCEAEQALQHPARTLDPMLLKRVGQDLLHRIDVDRAERAALRRLERRGLDLAETIDGMVAVSGLFDPISGATVLAAIDSLVAPTRENDTDERSWSQRRADALTDICRGFLDSGEGPVAGGVRPHLSVIVDIATLRRQLGCGTGELAWTGSVTAGEVRLIGCDSVVSRIVTDGASQVLDVGRATRTVPPAIRRAVIARDRHCAGPGCHALPAHCDVHHIVFWEDGGDTSLSNSVLLCRRHHGFVHQRGWQVIERDGGGKTLAPPRDRPRPRHLRNATADDPDPPG